MIKKTREDTHMQNKQTKKKTWSQGYTTFSMLNSAEHKILNAPKYKNNKKFSIF